MLLGMIFLSALLLTGPPAETSKPSRQCDIVARVNRDLITKDDYAMALRDYRVELARRAESQHKVGQEKEDEINQELERTKSSILDETIDDLLLDQRASELGLAADPEVLKAIEDRLIDPDYANRASGDDIALSPIDLQKARAAGRRLWLHELVVQREVIIPIYDAITDNQRREYYEGHKQDFVLPGKVSLSEIFLPFEDGSEARVEMDAARLLVQLRAGGDFAKAIEEYSSKSRQSYATGGYLGSFATSELKTVIAEAISSLNPGESTEPIRMKDGYQILRLDGRIPDSLRDYNDPEVREQLSKSVTMSRAGAARKDYIARLRKNADIELCPGKR
jgi:parvulin-like peptidyl-prolyl isomerase